MLTKTIKYTDYNGNEREEKFLFNLSKAELIEMQLGEIGGLAETVKKLIETENTPEIVKIFKDLILKSYGEKSADGKSFIKINDDGSRLANRFAQSEAYSVLFTELATNSKSAVEFIKGIIPSDIKIPEEEIKKLTGDETTNADNLISIEGTNNVSD